MEDFLLQLLGELLGFILEFLFESLIEVAFGAAVAVVARAGRRFRIRPFLRATLSPTNPPLTILKFTLLGLGLGFLSVLVLPHPLVHPSKLHGISLLVSPVISGLVLGCIGRTVRQHGRTPVQIESFGYGFTFAFAMALIRLLMVR
jgi:hypothetical protein